MLTEEWPEFKPMYGEVYNLCRDIQVSMLCNHISRNLSDAFPNNGKT